jgi:VWFA-related protein
MKKLSSLTFTLVLLLSTISPVLAQSPDSVSQPQTDSGDEVVRITANLVQLDAVVTDKKGRLVTDLTADDFEVFEDGRPQKVTNLSFITTDSTLPARTASAPSGNNAPATPPPSVRVQPEQVRRTIALVVDDICLSWTSSNYVRKALRKFVDEQMQPDDLVAIIRTAGSIGVLQQFTSDKRQLYAAIEQVKWYPTGCNNVQAYSELNNSLNFLDPGLRPQMTKNNAGNPSDVNLPRPAEIDQLREDIFTTGTMGALAYIVRGLKDLPGRKSILLVSDGINLKSNQGMSRILEAINRVTDLANRSSVVIYTMDARGLMPVNFTAGDSAQAQDVFAPSKTEAKYNTTAENTLARAYQFAESQAGLIYLAKQTGGFPVVNTNDLAKGIRRVMEDQQGYYLIGYRPEESTFDAKTGRRRFHQLTVKVKRPGLTVRTRKGFFGVADEDVEAAKGPLTRGQRLVKALISPFNSDAVDLRLTSLFGNDPRSGSYVRSLVYIDAKDLTFKEEADGWHQAVIDLLAVTFGDNGQTVDQVNKTQTIRVRGKTYESVLRNGLVYFMNVPVKKAGVYQLRVAVRDAATEQIGSASQFIEVPDLSKKRLTLSGLIVSGYEQQTEVNKVKTAGEDFSGGAAQGEVDAQASAAVRRFRQGTMMNFGYIIYNAQLDKATGRPQMDTQLRIFRNGQPILSMSIQPGNLRNQSTALVGESTLRLGTDMPPGEYVLQLVVTDQLAKDRKNNTAIQWVDFEIVK